MTIVTFEGTAEEIGEKRADMASKGYVPDGDAAMVRGDVRIYFIEEEANHGTE